MRPFIPSLQSLLAFESADHPLHAWMARALELVREQAGDLEDTLSRLVRFGLLDAAHRVLVAECVGRILVGGQPFDPIPQQAVQPRPGLEADHLGRWRQQGLHGPHLAGGLIAGREAA